jgi:hypothetical protein
MQQMTKKRLTYIRVISAAQHGGFVAFMLAYPGVALMRFFQSYDPQRQGIPNPTPWWVFWIVMPVVFAVFGAVLTSLSCFAYNLSAKLLGGVRYEDYDAKAGVVFTEVRRAR